MYIYTFILKCVAGKQCYCLRILGFKNQWNVLSEKTFLIINNKKIMYLFVMYSSRYFMLRFLFKRNLFPVRYAVLVFSILENFQKDTL